MSTFKVVKVISLLPKFGLVNQKFVSLKNGNFDVSNVKQVL